MENVPWHKDIKDFVETMVKAKKGEYELACENVMTLGLSDLHGSEDV